MCGNFKDFFSIITTNWDKVLLLAIRKEINKEIYSILKKNNAGKITSNRLKPNKKNHWIDNRKDIPLIDYCTYTDSFSDEENHIPSFKIKCACAVSIFSPTSCVFF